MRLRCWLCAVAMMLPCAPAQTTWKLIWSDEFDGAANARPDSSKWAYDLGGGGWGNSELETYTNASENAHLDGQGNLVIRASGSSSTGYTSARLKTQGKFSTTYGKIEARIKIPFGQGIWPAFWMLGSDIATVGWPNCGEIDIMENIGREPAMVHGSLHGPGYSGGNPITATYTLSSGRKFADDFHIFSVVWTPEQIEYFVDTTSYLKASPASLPAGRQWVFNKGFFLLLNVAVGGQWPGNPNTSTVLPQEMTVDYVRVYESTYGPAIAAKGVVNAASFSSALSPGSLATLYGSGLAANTTSDLFDASAGMFAKSAGTTVVSVNGVPSPLTFVSPEQINFQVPWETPAGIPVQVQVIRDGVASNSAEITLAATAPGAFSANGLAILTCVGTACTLWGNGFGPKTPPQRDGIPGGSSPPAAAMSTCKLVIGGIDASLSYCGSAPGLIIDQLNFKYPDELANMGPVLDATLTVGDASSELQVPLVR